MFFEWLGKPYHSASNGTPYDNSIDFAGGFNIAGNESEKLIREFYGLELAGAYAYP